jgi:hypothetical protein
MAWRPHDRAEVDADNPRGWARCGRCYCLTNHYKLRWQFRFAGPRLINTNLLVCENCLDIPNPQERTIVIPPDPVPIKNARPSDTSVETDYLSTDNDFYIEDDTGDNFVIGGENPQ